MNTFEAFLDKQKALLALLGNNPATDNDASVAELSEYNKKVYEDILPENYACSYVNPDYACELFGKETGCLLSFVASEVRAAIPSSYEEDLTDLEAKDKLVRDVEAAGCDSSTLKRILEAYIYDNYLYQREKRMRCALIPGEYKWANTASWIMEDASILYRTGEYVGDNELKMYRFLSSLPEAELESMAATYVDGYVKGFEVTGRDLSIKETAEIRFNIGFLPMMEYAVKKLKKTGLDFTLVRAGYSVFTGRSVDKNGFFGGNPNPQFDYDHKDDIVLFISPKFNEMRIDTLTKLYEKYKCEARHYAGPAVVDIFGEVTFEPVQKDSKVSHSDESRKLVTAFTSAVGSITNKYIPGDERSFTIIAYPVPTIGDRFEDIFKDTIRINTLDYVLYRDIQQCIIDVLDTAEYVYVEGMGENRTRLLVHLHDITDPEHQTKFENCVADVNIPVGEVFTSPVLNGTDGVLHVTKVFLNGLEYRDLELTIKDGMIADYSCQNGKKLIEDNILFHHDTLPMGECAIGTNTTAYQMARKYGIEALMPILIAEKTGPHFAFGDTCYSHCEDLAVYNPDGKEIIARDNECSARRDTDPVGAYFNCHTDITIPYDELGELSAQKVDGTRIPIIKSGRFVLPGCEALNDPLS